MRRRVEGHIGALALVDVAFDRVERAIRKGTHPGTVLAYLDELKRYVAAAVVVSVATDRERHESGVSQNGGQS
jgi:hypothetical protein